MMEAVMCIENGGIIQKAKLGLMEAEMEAIGVMEVETINGGGTMMIYRTKYHAMEAAMSDEVAVRVEAGWMLIPRKHYKRWKRR